ncbi:hypothetical protein PUNSTDRAFT_135274 [Punctularia strigosozonata HHB-11173 SS5]|uniref:uncharacterized protein n=1 Tax=Punctularia strigosozonata (strain HHB-11173) TaxID=741275 RepID=UPI0004416A2B|nr:uncharacterized protein PUNSTDRAFT_135274 [Punctularia strigosozonata HHB-11173 SS5]EIN07752.1 hypothetical protein PUNSTDRAFT_135274 [Punctularia strigosozonata HHB-11173 SS5]
MAMHTLCIVSLSPFLKFLLIALSSLREFLAVYQAPDDTSITTATLPIELIAMIVRELHDGSSYPDSETRHALCSLCSISRYLHQLVTPLLYTSIRVSLPGGRCTVLSESRHISSHLRNLSVSVLDFERSMLPELRAEMVALCSLLTKARHTLRTLICGMPFEELFGTLERLFERNGSRKSDLESSFFRALESLSSLETAATCDAPFHTFSLDDFNHFVHLRPSSPGGTWLNHTACPRWPALRRLFLIKPLITERFADDCLALPHLETLVFYRAQFTADYHGLVMLVEAQTHLGLPLTVINYQIGWEMRTVEGYDILRYLMKAFPNLHIIEPSRLRISLGPKFIQMRAETGELWEPQE